MHRGMRMRSASGVDRSHSDRRIKDQASRRPCATILRPWMARLPCAIGLRRATNKYARIAALGRTTIIATKKPAARRANQAAFPSDGVAPEAESTRRAMRAEAIFSRPIKLIWPVQSHRQKYSAFPKSDSVLLSCHLSLARGAYRGRHGRGAGGAVDAMAAQRIFAPTNADVAYGQVAWSWHPDADAPTVARPKRVVVHGDQKARRTGERAKQPLRSSRGECRLPG